MSASLQWMAVAFVLYFEIGLTLLLVLPLLKPSSWKWIFSLQVFAAIRPVWTTVYYAILLILVVLFVDAIRTMVKYGEADMSTLQLSTKIERHLQECRGQRNFYITGFALFLVLVIRRLITMLSACATLEASHTAAISQARAASRELQRRIDAEQEGGGGKGGGGEEPVKTKIKEPTQEELEAVQEGKTKGPTQEELEAVQEELKKSRTDLEAIKKQAESTNREYDRLAEENQNLQNRLQELEVGEEEDKKDQ